MELKQAIDPRTHLDVVFFLFNASIFEKRKKRKKKVNKLSAKVKNNLPNKPKAIMQVINRLWRTKKFCLIGTDDGQLKNLCDDSGVYLK